MLHDIFLAFWFFLPAGIGNAAAVIAAKLPIVSQYDAPLDFGMMLHGERLLGSHKTIRGLIAAIIAATIAVWLQRLPWAAALSQPIRLYETLPILVFGPMLGVGAIGGDAIKSFFKRRRRLLPGSSWVPFDQMDYVLGAILMTIPFARLPLMTYFWAILLWPVTHIAASALGYFLQVKDSPI